MVENEKKVDERRSFEGPDGDAYYISPPTADDIRGADWNYSKTYTKALMENISTSAEMVGILMKRGIIGTEFDQRQRELSDIMSERILKLGSAKDIDERQKNAIDVANAREELFQWNQRLNGPMSNTCEQIADDARLEYLTSSIIQTTSGDRVWESYDVYLQEKSRDIAMRARFEVMLYLQGLESDFLENTPEALALKDVREEIQKSITDIVDKDTVKADTVIKPKAKGRPKKDKTKSTTKSSK